MKKWGYNKAPGTMKVHLAQKWLKHDLVYLSLTLRVRLYHSL